MDQHCKKPWPTTVILENKSWYNANNKEEKYYKIMKWGNKRNARK